MSNFYEPDDIIIEPSYTTLKSYRARYNYDLLGHPIGTGQDFMRNPAGYLRTQISEYKLELIFSSIFLFMALLGFLLLQEIFGRLVRSFKLVVKFSKEWFKTRKEVKKRCKYGLPINPDVYAQVIYRALNQYYKIQSGSDAIPIPETAIEYEAIRFALECAWATGPGLRTLLEADPFLTAENEPIEGLQEDEELERMLQNMMPPIPEGWMTTHTDDALYDPNPQENYRSLEESPVRGVQESEGSDTDETLSGPIHHEVYNLDDYEGLDVGEYEYDEDEIHEPNIP
ncbi:hypothetical protein FGIG_10230 [Fasciola gigantica]|uniref:Uncharacterized protein n=1 Tax=Fasciola gigantica TaxID=46835 RepID=A0A504YNX1_FASGI|nr:hypothetical protein FGIG_10230 [Fasciola gigantica]